MTAGLLRALHNIQPISHIVIMAPTYESALGNVTHEGMCQHPGRQVKKSWFLFNPFVVQIGETKATVIHFTDLLIFCHTNILIFRVGVQS